MKLLTSSFNALQRAFCAFLVVACGALLGSCGESDDPAQPQPLPLVTVQADLRATCLAAADALGSACPSKLPAPAKGQRLNQALDLEGAGDFAGGDDAWLLSWAYRDPDRQPPDGRVFHVIAGARAAEVGDGDPLRRVGSAGLEPGDPPGTELPQVPPRRLGLTTVGDAQARVLAWEGMPAGGTIHAGHQGLTWMDGGITYVVSAHFVKDTSPQRRLATLRAVAKSFRPSP